MDEQNVNLDMAPNEEEVVLAPESDAIDYVNMSVFEKIKTHISLALKWMWFCFMQTLSFIFTKPNPKEGILQFFIRQLMLSDSKGNPSWTITILVYVMVIVGYTIHYSTVIAVSPDATIDPATGKIIAQHMKGYPTEFWYFIMVLAGIIMTAFNSKSAATQAADTGVEPTGVITKVINAASSIITQIKGSK